MIFYVSEFQKLLLKWEGPKCSERFLTSRYSQPKKKKTIVPTHSPQGHTSSPAVVLSWSAKNPVSRWRSCFPRAPGFEVVRMRREPPGCKSPCVSIICIFNTKLLKLRPFYFFITFLGLFIGIFKNWYDTFDSRNWLHIIHGVIKDVFDGEICPQNSWLWYQ